MDKKYIILLIIIVLLCIAAALAYAFSGERLAKRIVRENVSYVTVTYRRKAYSFTKDSDISRLCAAAEKIRLSRFAVRDNSVNSKIGGNFFVTFKYKDGTALDLCFNDGFAACRVGTEKWRKVLNPEDAKQLALDFNFEKEE